MADATQRVIDLYGGGVVVVPGGVQVRDQTKLRSPATDRLVWQAVFGAGDDRDAARWLLWELGQVTGARPASINDLYLARGRGECGGFTVPAINVRMLAYDTARAIFRTARAGKAGAIIQEIARSEIAYTDQRPAEYVSVLIGAALREGYVLPLFIQGDHCQVNHKKYQADPEGEVGEVKKLIAEEVGAGFYNIDVDTSTLVDLAHPTLEEQQRLNYERAAEITAFIREREPAGVTVSVGAEIGEEGMKNSNVEELHAFMQGYNRSLAALGPTLEGISKISVQTGTSHGGVVLADGTMADVKLDLQALASLSQVARDEYGLAGAVQHGASTLPEVAFGRFADANAIEVHLATAFQNQIFEHPAFPADLKDEIYGYLSANHADERKEGQTDAQFFYGARKRAFGPFKRQLWDLSVETRDRIANDLEGSFNLLMQRLGVAGSAELVDRIVPRVDVPAPMPDALAATLAGEVVMAGARAEATLEEVEGE